jgi:hypothetical protein
MGMKFATEYCQLIFESATLHFEHQDDVIDFLQKDLIFGTQYIPGLCVSKISVSVRQATLDKDTGVMIYRSYGKVPKQYYMDTIKGLDVTRILPSRPGSTLEIDNDRDKRMDEVLYPFLFDMKEKGFRISTSWGSFGAVTTRAEWEKKVKNGSAFVSILIYHNHKRHY